MHIKDFFTGILGGGREILRTPHGELNLSKPSDRKRMNKMLIELQRSTDALTR